MQNEVRWAAQWMPEQVEAGPRCGQARQTSLLRADGETIAARHGNGLAGPSVPYLALALELVEHLRLF